MRVNLTNYATTQFRVLSDDQIERIFLGALELLADPGTVVHGDQARQMLADAGAIVHDKTVRIPAGLIREMLTKVPERIVVGNRHGKRTLVLESHRIFYGTGSDCPFIIDAETGQRRLFTKKDTEDAARVVDACENLDFHMSLGLTSDVPTYSYDRHQAAAMIRNTVKPLCFTAMSRDGLSDILEMYYLLRGSREEFEANPGFIVYLEPITPLTHGKAVMEKLIFSAERRIPAIYTPCPMLGATAPVTLAGGLTLSVAEFLTGMVISQLASPGAPLIMGGVISSIDMRSTTFTYGSPELHIATAALTDIAHWMNIPMFGTAGCSDSKVLDEQAALEAALSIMSAGLSGGNLIHDVGFLDSALIGSHEMVVLSDEIIGMVKRYLRGVRVDEDTLALEVTKEVGAGGNFITHEHTACNFRRELWFPKLISREKFDAWQAGGSKTLGDRVRAKAKEIIATHRVPPLPEQVDAGIDKILARADKRAQAKDASLT